MKMSNLEMTQTRTDLKLENILYFHVKTQEFLTESQYESIDDEDEILHDEDGVYELAVYDNMSQIIAVPQFECSRDNWPKSVYIQSLGLKSAAIKACENMQDWVK